MATAPRSSTYNVGGRMPFGWTTTPVYNANNAPNLANGEISLYERQGRAVNTGNPDLSTFSNPPFIGIGSSNKSVPSYMKNADGSTRRILRGYMRRSNTYPFVMNGSNQFTKASHTQLHFMYNPTDLDRSYVALAQSDQYTTTNSNDARTAHLKGAFMTSIAFVLFFDRAIEVATQLDHPGVLIDLAVFDMLIGASVASGTDMSPQNNPPATPAATATNQLTPEEQAQRDISTYANGEIPLVPRNKPAPDPVDTGSGGDTAIAENVQNTTTNDAEGFDGISWDSGLEITVVISPSLSFKGTISDISVKFEKFSHRMTPTRMSIYVGMQLTDFGEEQAATMIDPGVQTGIYSGTIPSSTGTSTAGGGGPVSAGGSSPGLLNDHNFVMRQRAMAWAAQWVNKVPYNSGTARCIGAANDREVGGMQPTALDCSSLTSRSLWVIGWHDLGIWQCEASDAYITASKNKPDKWWTQDLNGFRSAPNRYKLLNHLLQSGDLLLRITGKKPDGSRAEGHIVWVYKDAGGPDDGTHKWTILHSPSPGKFVSLSSYTTQQIMDGADGVKRMDWIARPKGTP